MVHNTVAVETRYDPSNASLRFYWRTRDGRQAAFASGRGGSWLWPSDGVRLGDKLLLFYMRIRPDRSKKSLGFREIGSASFLVNNPDTAPPEWVLRRLKIPQDPWSTLLGVAVLKEGGYLYAFGVSEPSHDAYLARWPVSDAADGDLSSPEWWCGSRLGWVRQEEIRQAPVVVLPHASTEFSVQRNSQLRGYLEVQSVGFGASEIAIRQADTLYGPWSRPVKVYRPPESDDPRAFVYAAKAHPELTGADVVITYVANSFDERNLATNMNIYFPRFVRLDLRVIGQPRSHTGGTP
jgi:hypothetical protein